jgi:hypothetical protein
VRLTRIIGTCGHPIRVPEGAPPRQCSRCAQARARAPRRGGPSGGPSGEIARALRAACDKSGMRWPW